MMEDLELAIHAARVAGDFLRRQYQQVHTIRMKSALELVTEVDRQTEKLIAESLRQGRPGYGFLGEEGSQGKQLAAEAIWIVDPIDGTTNFVRHISVYAVSIGLAIEGEAVLGVIYQPILDELFAAEKGGGATLNGKPIHVSLTNEIGKALLGSGFPYNAWNSPVDNVAQWGRAVKRAFGVLCSGVAALGLCEVAAGRMDGYWELNLFPWDIAAGAVIVNEAGGKVTMATGEPFDPFGNSIVASNGLIHEELMEMIQGENRSFDG